MACSRLRINARINEVFAFLRPRTLIWSWSRLIWPNRSFFDALADALAHWRSPDGGCTPSV